MPSDILQTLQLSQGPYLFPHSKKRKWVHLTLNIMGFACHFLFNQQFVASIGQQKTQDLKLGMSVHGMGNLRGVGGKRGKHIIKIHQIIYQSFN